MRTPILLALALSLAACGGSTGSTDTAADAISVAQTAISDGSYSKAVSALEPFLGDTAAPEYQDVALLYCEALAESDPDGVVTKMGELIEGLEDLTPKDVRGVVSYLQTHEHYVQAVAVMDLGMKKWEGDETMIQVKDVLVGQVQAAGDEAATAALKGLGYL